jgi:hypothetical protein
MNFKMDVDKMIQTAEDALSIVEVGESEEDILNEVNFGPSMRLRGLY